MGTVAYVISTAYSGSSLLNLLLDAHPRIRGLGEAVHFVAQRRKPHCVRCQRPVQECPVSRAVDRDAFYRSLFEYYRDCDVLVDSSKLAGACLGAHRFEPKLDHKVLLLSKAPHEFAFSWIGHHPRDTLTTAFRRYLDFYESEIETLSRQPWFRPWSSLPVTYRNVATTPDRTVEQICEFLGVERRPVEQWWKTDTHVVGGNWMVAAQANNRRKLFDNLDWYLRGKYQHRYHTVFYDSQWQRDSEFLQGCLRLYKQHEKVLTALLPRLRQPDFRQQVSDLETALLRNSSRPPAKSARLPDARTPIVR